MTEQTVVWVANYLFDSFHCLWPLIGRRDPHLCSKKDGRQHQSAYTIEQAYLYVVIQTWLNASMTNNTM